MAGPRILLRADASPSIGNGHVSRCRTLGLELVGRGIDVHLASASMPDALAATLRDDGFLLHAVPSPAAGDDDAAATGALAEALGCSLIAVDGYAFGEAFCALVRGRARALLYVDDLGIAPRSCDGVLDANVYADELAFDVAPSTDLLLGPAFALVRPSFVRARATRLARSADARSERAAGPRILVTMGGADAPGFGARALEALVSLPAHAELRVTVGSSSSQAPRVAATAARLAARVDILEGVNDLADSMSWCDLAVAAAGTTCLELACVGVPAAVVSLADNQRRVARSLAARGLAIDLGWHADVADAAILAAVTSLQVPARAAALSAALVEAVDGRGTERVADWIVKRLNARKTDGDAAP